MEAQAHSVSSAQTCSLPPKPPPTSGAMTRTWSSGMPICTAKNSRSRCGTCVEDQTVRLPWRYSAMTPRGSIAAPEVRWLTIRRSMTTSASAIAWSTSPPPIDHSCVLFVPSDSCTRISSLSASSTSTTTGSGSYSTRTVCAASTTPYLSSPMTIATASPTWLTSPRASGQRSGIFISTPGGAQAIGSGASRSLMSSPVTNAVMPGRASASEPSIETIFACASVERTTAM